MRIDDTERNKIQWQPIIELTILVVTTLGTTIPLYLHTDNKMQQLIAQNNARSDKLYEMFIDLLKERK